MSDSITVTGLVATAPKLIVTGDGLAITNFRLASGQRRYDRGQGKWVDGETNWYTVTAFRQLATNVAGSLQKGQRIVVTGRLRVRDWTHDDKKGTNVEIDAEAIGHDLSWGTAAFTRSAAAAVAEDAVAEADVTDRDVTAHAADPDVATGDEGSGQASTGDGREGDLGAIAAADPDDGRAHGTDEAPAPEAVAAGTPF